ncbi:MAG: hypothetical protein Q4B70_03035 [Lachnospiraceae bacterium]|nr:hypothetical protein [Lachnospiraceae bacterium]
METISDVMKKVLLAGIGAVAVTAEKSKEIVDELIAKGEITVEQGKVLNEELKHNVKETIHKATAEKPKEESKETQEDEKEDDGDVTEEETTDRNDE